MNETINLSLGLIDYESFDAPALTTQDILDLCGAMDTNALIAAGLGVVVSVAFMFYLSRWRVKCSKVQRMFVDKAVLTLIAMLFVAVIVRVARAG